MIKINKSYVSDFVIHDLPYFSATFGHIYEVVKNFAQIWGFNCEDLEHEWQQLLQCESVSPPTLYSERRHRGP